MNGTLKLEITLTYVDTDEAKIKSVRDRIDEYFSNDPNQDEPALISRMFVDIPNIAMVKYATSNDWDWQTYIRED